MNQAVSRNNKKKTQRPAEVAGRIKSLPHYKYTSASALFFILAARREGTGKGDSKFSSSCIGSNSNSLLAVRQPAFLRNRTRPPRNTDYAAPVANDLHARQRQTGEAHLQKKPPNSSPLPINRH